MPKWGFDMSGFVVSKNRLLKGQDAKGKVEPTQDMSTAPRSMVASLPARTATEFLQPTAEGTPDTPGIDQRMEALALARLQLKTKAEFKREIGKLWKTAQQRFLPALNRERKKSEQATLLSLKLSLPWSASTSNPKRRFVTPFYR